MRNAGVWAAVLLLLFSGIMLWQSLLLDYKGPLGFGPGFFPFWLSLVLAFLSILYLLSSLKEFISVDSIFPKRAELREFLQIVASMVLFIVLADIVGFVAAGTVAIYVLIYRSFNKYSSVLLSVGISLIIFFIFVKGLDVPLPVNSFGW